MKLFIIHWWKYQFNISHVHIDFAGDRREGVELPGLHLDRLLWLMLNWYFHQNDECIINIVIVSLHG